jgi:hypothetical protein
MTGFFLQTNVSFFLFPDITFKREVLYGTRIPIFRGSFRVQVPQGNHPGYYYATFICLLASFWGNPATTSLSWQPHLRDQGKERWDEEGHGFNPRKL